jgi:predicted phosphoadenosine phosphosulfate sulfurtransferase
MKTKIKNYIYDWENKCYKDGIPDEAPIRLEILNKVPSYRQIVKAILKNDINLESLGFSRPFCKAYSDIKRAELIERGVIKESNQIKLKI